MMNEYCYEELNEGDLTYGMGTGTKRGAMAAPRRAALASFFSLNASAEFIDTMKTTRRTARANWTLRRLMMTLKIELETSVAVRAKR